MKRKQYIDWLATVFGIFATVYGGYLLAWHFNHGNGLNSLALVLLILGIISLVFAITLLTSRYLFSKKKQKDDVITKVEEVKTEMVEEKKEEEKPRPKEEIKPAKERYENVERSSRSSYSYSVSSTVYVKQVGYGPLLRVEGSRIQDMRNNTYYRIEGNMVNQEGYGPRFEIRGNQIRDAFGGYLYELSGNNINKVYGGFYASISGSYISLYDNSIKYEITDSLSKKQILAVAALLFGN